MREPRRMPVPAAPRSDRTPRIRELDSRGMQVTHALVVTAIGMSVTLVATFLAVLVVGIVNLELDGFDEIFGLARDLDDLLRAMFAPMLILGAVLLVIGPVVFVARRAAVFTAASTFAAQHPADAPPRDVRDRLRSATPGGSLETAGVVGVLAFGFLFLVGVMITIGSLVEDPERVQGSVVFMVCAAVAALLSAVAIVQGKRREPAQKRRAEVLQGEWKATARRAAKAERGRRRTYPRAEIPHILRGGSLWWLYGILYLTVCLGMVVFIVGILLRQPCRFCEPRVLDPFGESAIDVFSGTGGALLIASGVGSAVLWLLLAAFAFAREETLRSWLTRSGGVRLEGEQRREMLGLPAAMTMLATLLAGIASVVLAVSGGAIAIDWPNFDPPLAWLTGGSLVLAALVVGMLGHRREVRLRMLVRDALMPGDITGDEDDDVH
ncbi:hypothetical protein AB0N59_00885 [Microbacterium sp. NPDC089321]|uniref:hypothetical protein n=1 Tax=Microbacterium sp. NPDC089321 TaxID=3155183 RepID=UPI00341848C9